MRNGGTFNVTSSPSTPMMPQQQQPPRSPWHSPVPYLFGGLAAMLGLIAFALLILACSYWKLSGYLDGGEGSADNNGENRDDVECGKAGDGLKQPQDYEEKILVIMAGDVKPTFLATPVSSRNSSFGDRSSSSSGTSFRKSEKLEEADEMEMAKQGSGYQVQSGN